MRQVLIVDDEYMLLRGIRKLIDWSALDAQIIATEQNPRAALEFLQTHHVDILLSDMNMPEMPGPEFVKAAKAIAPNMQLIVISGYSDFDYVKAGLQQHAVNYLTKPIDPDELVQAVSAASQRLDEQRRHATNDILAVQTQVRRLVSSDQDQRALLQALQLHFDDPSKPLRLLAILNPLPPQALVDYLQAHDESHRFFQEGQDYIVLFVGNDQQLHRFLNAAPHAVTADMRPVIIAPIAKDPLLLAETWEQLKQAINRSYFFEAANGLVQLSDTSHIDEVMLPSYATVRQAISGLEPGGFENWVQTIFSDLQTAHASVMVARQMALLILMVLEAGQSAFSDQPKTIAAINHARTVSELKATLAMIAQRFASASDHHYSRNVKAVRHIVHQRYAEPLTLSNVADELHLNAVYLGQLFKQETGRSFAQYRNDWRVSVAIEMLRNAELDINQIALTVGYTNPNYFYKIFKEQTGMSPQKFREVATA